MSTQEVLLTINPRSTTGEHRDSSTPVAPLPTRSADVAIILPRWIYIKDKDGRYLYERSGHAYSTISFRSGQQDLDCVFETDHVFTNWYQITARSGEGICRYYNGWYSGATSGLPSFHVISASTNQVYLKDNYSKSMYFSNELKDTGSPLAHESIDDSSLMGIVQAATKNEITNIKYDIEGAKVSDAGSIIVLVSTLRNDSDSTLNETITYTYEKWIAGTWNNVAGIEIGVDSTFTAGVPHVVDANFKVDVSSPSEHHWGGFQGERGTVSSSLTVAVPPKKRTTATIVIRNAQIDVGFTYTQFVSWANGQTDTTKESGIYTNMDSWNVDLHLGKWEDV